MTLTAYTSGANVDYLAIIGERPAGEIAMGESVVFLSTTRQTVELVGRTRSLSLLPAYQQNTAVKNRSCGLET